MCLRVLCVAGTMDVEIIRSDKRARTVSARLVEGKFVVRAPAHMSDAELQPIIDTISRGRCVGTPLSG